MEDCNINFIMKVTGLKEKEILSLQNQNKVKIGKI